MILLIGLLNHLTEKQTFYFNSQWRKNRLHIYAFYEGLLKKYS